MKTFILSNTDSQFNDANLGITLDYSDVAAVASGAAINLFTALAGTKVDFVAMKLNAGFDRTGTGALTLSVGDGNTSTKFMTALVVATDGAEVTYYAGTTSSIYVADDTVDAFFTDAGGMTYTEGSVTLYFRVADVSKWPIG